jgi:hypothetical protein
MAFKKKNKPGTGNRKKYKKSDLFTVKRYHGRKALVNLCGLLPPAIIFKNGWPSRTNYSKVKHVPD